MRKRVKEINVRMVRGGSPMRDARDMPASLAR